METDDSTCADDVPTKQPASGAADSRAFIRSLLSKLVRVRLTDGRVLVGQFLCTDREANVILGSCAEYVPAESASPAAAASVDNDDLDAVMRDTPEPRVLGLAMVKGKDIVSMHYDTVPGPPPKPSNNNDDPMYT